MADDLMDALGAAVEHKTCGVSGCQTKPIANRNGRPLCAKHRDHYDHSTMGEPCERCESRQWVRTPDGASEAVCAVCDYVTYDADKFKDSW
ncbi:hypothetical protein KM295_14260 [Natronomonas sp. F2-12]|uniref:Uncharacterized protein n=1 Tax=Natronomonas aquatica TaxID=2841590 RepID=A0A9R1D5R7_9EURY|nr:hypothetical protein [Natronomonas aquatica]MCQ4334619.1 hypothetical protein [Natronomonas aquatica]